MTSQPQPQTQPHGLTGALSQAQAAQVLGNYRFTPATLYSKLDPSWIPAKWLQYLSLKIAQAVARGNCGLVISAPPRHGKSMLITEATPIWALENFQNKHVVVATYGGDLSTDFSRKIRDMIQNRPDVLSVRLRKDTQRVDDFHTTQGGSLRAVGLRGAITGRGAHLFILDDYIKEPKEAMSATYLEGLWTWYQTVARTRLEPGAVIIIVATRWVQNDIHGRIERMQKMTGIDRFEFVRLPALAEEGDPLGRLPGEALFPQRYEAAGLEEIRLELGSRWFEAMFQQNPQGNENSAVNADWIQLLDRSSFEAIRQMSLAASNAGRFQWVRSWDFASTKDAGDYTAGCRGLYDKVTERFYIEDMVHGQYSSAQVENIFRATTQADAASCPGIKTEIEKEPGSSGEYTIRHFEGIARSVVPGTNIRVHKPTSAKLLNAQPFLAAAEASKVYMVEGSWNNKFIDELSTFPEGSHDDQIDAVSNAYKLASGKRALGATWGRQADARRPNAVQVPTIRKNSVVWGRDTNTGLILPRMR